MYRKSITLLFVLGISIFASADIIGYVTETTNGPNSFNLLVQNITSQDFNITYVLTTVGGSQINWGPFDVPAGNGRDAGFGGFPTTGTWTLDVWFGKDEIVITEPFADIFHAERFAIDPPSPTPEPASLVLLGMGLIVLSSHRSWLAC